MDATRFISAGALAGGGLIVGALRRGDRRDQVAELVADDSDTLLSMWVKIDEADTAIVRTVKWVGRANGADSNAGR